MTMRRELLYGLAFVIVLALLAAGTVALYRDAFRDTLAVVVATDRAGLTMDVGAVVKIRGVEVGRVDEVRPVGDGAELDVEIDRSAADRIPADVVARIVPPTAFGSKYVELRAPRRSSSAAVLEAGATIQTVHVTTEVDDAFANLTVVLDAARPAEVNAALTGVARAIDGRGALLGDLITRVDSYLRSFNPALPLLADDLERVMSVVRTYDAAAPDLLATAEDLTTTADTISAQEASLQAFLINLRSVAAEVDDVVDSNGEPLADMLGLLEPVSAVLAKYSPELPCVIRGVVVEKNLAEVVVGGANPGITTFTQIQPGDDAYQYPTDLPEVGDARGPNCFGLPTIQQSEVGGNPHFETGTDPYGDGTQTADEDLSTTFFGVLGGILNGATLDGRLPRQEADR